MHLLNESDLSALAEASLRLEELEATVGRILSQVERATQPDDDVNDDSDDHDIDTSPEVDTTYPQSCNLEEPYQTETYLNDSQITRSSDIDQFSASSSDIEGVVEHQTPDFANTSYDSRYDCTQGQYRAQIGFDDDDTVDLASRCSHSVYEPNYERYNYREFEDSIDDRPRNYKALETYEWSDKTMLGSANPDYYSDGRATGKINPLQSGESCSLEDLEKCIDRLVQDVQREEARLRKELMRKENFEARCGRFSLPAPPRSLPLRSAHSASMDSVAVGSDIWWEGAYRNARHTPEGQERSGSSLSSNESDSDEPRGSVMLLVRTTEEGKEQIEIRSTRHPERVLNASDTNNNDPNLTSRIFVHSPPDVYEMHSFHGTTQSSDSRPLEYSPPASLVQYVYPSTAEATRTADTGVQYVSPSAATPPPSYCTWLPSPDSLEQPRQGGGLTATNSKSATAPCLNIDQSKSGEIGRSYDSSVPSQTVVVQEVVTPSIQGIVHGKGAGPEIASSPPKGEVKGTLAVETKSGLPVKFTVDVKKEVKLDANKIEDAIGNDRKQSSDPTQGKEKDGSDQGVEKKSGTEESKEDKEKGDAPSESDSKEGPVVSASSSIQEKLSKEATKKGGSSESEKDTDTTEVDEGKDVSLKDRKSSYNAEKDLKQGDKEKGLKKTAEEANVKQNEDDTKDNSVKMDINETQKLLDVIDGKDAKSDHVGKEAKQQLQEFTEEREKKGAVEEKKHDVKESEKRKEPTEKELTEERKDGGPKKPDSKTSEGTQDIGDGVKRRGSKGSGKGKGLKDGNDTIGVEQDKGSKGSGKDKGAKDSKGSEKDKGPSDSLKRQDSEGIGKGKGSKDSPKKQDSQGSKRDGGPKDCPKHDSKGNEKEKGPKDSPKRQDLKGDKDKGTKDSPKKQNSKGSEKDKDFKESYKGQDPKGSEKDKDIKDSPKRQDSTGGAKSKGVKDNLQGLDPKKSNSGKDKDSPKRQNSSSGEKGKGAKIGVKDFLETEKATDSKEILKERSNQESEKDNDTKESIKTMSGTDKGATSDGGFHSERVDAKNDGKDRKKVLAKEDKENGSNHGEYSEKVPEHEKTDASTTAIVETKEQVLSSGDPGKQNVTVSSEKTTVSTNAVGIKPQVVETVTKVTKPLDFKEKPLLDVVSCTSERDKPKTSETKTQKDEQNAEIKTRVPDQKSDTDPHEPSILQKQISVEATKSFIQLEQAHTMSLLGNDMIPLKVNEQASASSVPGSVPVTSLDKASIEIVPKVEDIENAPKQISEQVLTSVKAETSKTQTEPSCDSAKDPSCTVAKTSEKVPLETAQLIDLGSKTPVNELESSQQPRTLHLVEETVKPKSLDAEKTIQEDETFVEPGKHSVELQGKSDKSGVNTSERPDDKLVKDDIAAKIVKLVENLPKTDDKPMVVDSTSDKPKDYLQKPDETGAKVDEAAKQTGVLPGTVLEQTIDDHTKQFSESSTQQKTSNAEPHFVVGDIPSDIVATTSLLESERLHLNLRETEPSMSSQGWGKQVSSETPKGAVGPADKTFPQSAGASLLTETLTKTISTAVGNEPTISSTAVTKMTSAQGSEASHYEKSAPIQTIETSTTSVSRTRNSVQQPSAAIVHQKSEDSSILVSFPAEVSKAPISAGETISQTIETKTGNGGKSEQVITTTVRKMPLTKEGSIEQAVTITEKTVVEGSPRELKKDWDYEIDSGSFLDDDFLKNTPKISVKETVTVTTFKRASPAKSSPVDVSDVKLTSQSKTKEVSYVTTPTMARRTQSQRRSREERRFPVDVTHAQADYSSDEDTPYTVTEPSDERTEDRYRINSSPEILSVTSHSTSATPQKPSGSLSSEHHKVMFQLGSMDSQDSSPDLPSEAISPSKLIKKESEQFQNRTKEEELAILTELASSALKTPSPVSVTTTQIRTDPGSSNIITQTSSVSFSRSDSREGSQESDLSREEKKLRRVERHFERMASQTLQGEDLPPEERDADFQRMVSQLSTEEMAGSQEQYLQLLDEGGASPDWDSRDPETDDSPEESSRRLAGELDVGRVGSVVQPPKSHPLPTPRGHPSHDRLDDRDTEPAIEEDIQSYADRKKFWERMSTSGSSDTMDPDILTGTVAPAPRTALPTSRSRPVSITESVDSEAEYLSKYGTNTEGIENDGFEDDEHCHVKRKPEKTMSVDNDAPPPVAVRKTAFERSVSLPVGDSSDASVKTRKQFFEEQIRKDIVVENLMKQLEEEAPQEHKELPEVQTPTRVSEPLGSRSQEDVVTEERTTVFETLHSVDMTQGEDFLESTVLHQAEQHIIEEPQEEIEEWRGVRDLKSRFENLSELPPESEPPFTSPSLSDVTQTATEIRRESLARTHIASTRLAEVMQYKSESITKPSDSLEVHVDKSETEDTEKSRDLDEDIKAMEIEEERRAMCVDGKTISRLPSDQPGSQSSSEDTQCESDVTPEDHPYIADDSSMYQPQQHIQDTVWEVGVQDQGESAGEEFAPDFGQPKSIVLENGDLHEEDRDKYGRKTPTITEEEARQVAEVLVQDIEEEVARRVPNLESALQPSQGPEDDDVAERIRELAEEKFLEEREIQLMQSVINKKSREQSLRYSRTDTATSSMEITDEDLRSSFVETDLSPSESQAALATIGEHHQRINSLPYDDEKIELADEHEHVKTDLTSSKKRSDCFVIEESEEVDRKPQSADTKKPQTLFEEHGENVVVEKTLQEVRQSLGLAQEELIEEQKERVIKQSPSEFAFKGVTLESTSEGDVGEFQREESATNLKDSKSSPTGSTGSIGSNGKRTPPPKPERKSIDSSSSKTVVECTSKLDSSEETTAHAELQEIAQFKEKTNVEVEVQRACSIDSQKSSSQDESAKSPAGTGDSGKSESAEPPLVVRRHIKTDGESSSSGEKSGSANLKPDRRSGADFEAYSSSSESHYCSFEQSYSRPCSSDVENLLSGGLGTTGSSEYESAIASARSVTSGEYQTAVSSLSSRESMKSLDSESSGHLASVEVSSEASETLVPSATELERDMEEGLSLIIMDDDMERRILEPYDTDIPADVIRGEAKALFGMSSYSRDVAGKDSEYKVQTDDSDDEDIPLGMKRSHEMTFHPDHRQLENVKSETSIETHDEKLTSSIDDSGSVLSMSLSSASEAQAVRTVVEVSHAESDKMDASVTSDQLSLTVSATSDQMSLSSGSREETAATSCSTPVAAPRAADVGIATCTKKAEGEVTSVTIMASTVDENGVQSVSTQVISETSQPGDGSNMVDRNGSTESTHTSVEAPRRSHRRNESTSIFTPILPPKIPHEVSNFTGFGYGLPSQIDSWDISFKEKQHNEKKDVDDLERFDDTDQSDISQSLRKDMLNSRPHSEEIETDIELLDSSRPHSQVSKSDSEGHRPVSSGFSDDRPDSELADLLKQSEVIDDPIERPLSPEPQEEADIKDETPEFSSEALASVTELELEYSNAFSRSVEYASHVSPIREKPCSTWDQAPSDHEDEAAEAEAAFHMVPHHSPALHSVLPDTIPEDPDSEKIELETRERLLNEAALRRQAQAISPAAIPDITVTQHLAPLIDRDFQYPDLDLEEAEALAESSSLPKATQESDASDCREEPPSSHSDAVDMQKVVDIKPNQSVESHPISGKDDQTEAESPTSESFELVEESELAEQLLNQESQECKRGFSDTDADDFVVVEEVAKEAAEQDKEGKGIKINQRYPVNRRSVPDEYPLPAPAPVPITRMTDLKFYPENARQVEVGPFEFDPEGDSACLDIPAYDDISAEAEFEAEAEAELEASKKWVEMQFQGEQPAPVSGGTYAYEMDFERGPLEDIKEEDEMASSSKIGSLSSQNQSVGSFGSVKESLSSTPEYDVLAGRKFFTRSGDHDDVSMSSLQEFENLEQQIAMESARKKMISSQDSLNGTAMKRPGHGHGDDISLASLKEFENMEQACVEAEKIEHRAKVEEMSLTQIEEGHESQVSESESCETMSATGLRTMGDSDSEDYEKRMFEIDEIIRQAQSNVEKFVEGRKVRVDPGGTESYGRGDSIEEVAMVPDLDLDDPAGSMFISSDSLDLRISKPDSMITSTDSLDVRSNKQMTTSADSIEMQAQSKVNTDIMTDSIELPADHSHMATSSDSLELSTTRERMVSESIDDEEASLQGKSLSGLSGTGSGADRSSSSGRDFSSSGKEDLSGAAALGRDDPMDPLMLGSTDSLDPSSSSGTHATYQYETDSVMSSSFTSGCSNTMVSSTETLEASALSGVWFEDNVEGKPFVSELIEPSNDGEYSHTVRRTVQMPAEVRKVTFRGPDADRALQEYMEKFDAGVHEEESRVVDPDGNVHISRVVQKKVILGPGEFDREVTHEELEECMKRLGHGSTPNVSRDVPSSSSHSSEIHHTMRHITPELPPGAVVDTQQGLTTSHLTADVPETVSGNNEED